MSRRVRRVWLAAYAEWCADPHWARYAWARYAWARYAWARYAWARYAWARYSQFSISGWCGRERQQEWCQTWAKKVVNTSSDVMAFRSLLQLCLRFTLAPRLHRLTRLKWTANAAPSTSVARFIKHPVLM